MLELNCYFFNSEIGRIFYIWTAGCYSTDTKRDGSGRKKSSGKGNNDLLIFLSNSEKSFYAYREKLKSIYPDVFFSDKKSPEIETSVNGYLDGKRKKIGLKYRFLTGSSFEQRIWKTTASISYGRVASYKEIAEKSGSAGAWRAAGTALGNNPLMLVIPCHRVIKSSGDIGFFGGGEKIKEFLLDLEAG